MYSYWFNGEDQRVQRKFLVLDNPGSITRIRWWGYLKPIVFSFNRYFTNPPEILLIHHWTNYILLRKFQFFDST